MSRPMRGLVVIWLVATAVCVFSEQRKDCWQIVLGGEVKDGEKFTREIGNDLSFRLDPWKDGEGWEFEIGPTHPERDEWNQYVYTLTPPYRSRNSRDVNTGWGTPAQEAVYGSREFWFMWRRDESKKAGDALQQVLWPKSDADQQAGLNQLGSLAKGRGEFHVVDSKVTPAPENDSHQCGQECGAIHWIKFQASLVVPRTFKPAAGLDHSAVACPDLKKWF